MTTHRESHPRTPRYEAWHGMHQRCANPNSRAYANYGGRGIKVCKRWGAYENFAADMGELPGSGWTLDRINNNGDYEPTNCRWASYATQNQNRRITKLTKNDVLYIRDLRDQGETFAALAKQFNVSIRMIFFIVKKERWGTV